jgi:hypothetical protein
MLTPERHLALVEQLVEASAPVQRLWPVRRRAAAFALGWAAAGALVATVSPRPDLAQKLRDPGFVSEMIALTATTVCLILLALRCAVPGRAPGRAAALLALLLTLGTAAALAFPPATSAMENPWRCSLGTVALAAPPWLMLLIAVRRGAPVRVGDAAVYAGSAALLFATTVLRTACPADGTQHWLLWHFGTLLLVVLTTPLLARWLRTWRHA